MLTFLQARNALSTQLLSELSGVVEGLHREGGKGSTRALILASETDNSFCAGADLKVCWAKDFHCSTHLLTL
jgi:methylglutaconyl-CoA hydratase